MPHYLLCTTLTFDRETRFLLRCCMGGTVPLQRTHVSITWTVFSHDCIKGRHG